MFSVQLRQTIFKSFSVAKVPSSLSNGTIVGKLTLVLIMYGYCFAKSPLPGREHRESEQGPHIHEHMNPT